MISVFTSSDDPALIATLRRLMVLVAAVNLFDGFQTILTGVIQAGGWRLGKCFAAGEGAVPSFSTHQGAAACTEMAPTGNTLHEICMHQTRAAK